MMVKRHLTTIVVSSVLMASTTMADETTPRRMFVEAEQLRRADVCDVGQKGDQLDPLAKALAYSFIEHMEKARQLSPLLPALTNLGTLTADQRSRLVDCLGNWREAARIEQQIMDAHPGSEVAYDLAQKRRLKPEEVDGAIARVEGFKPAEEIVQEVLDERKDDAGYNEQQRQDLERLMDNREDAREDSSSAALTGSSLTSDEIQDLRMQLASCWSPPVGARDAEMKIEIRAELTPDGSVQSARLLSRERMDEAFYRATAESAMRALRICSPLKLPNEKYNAWKVLDLSFDPQRMLGD